MRVSGEASPAVPRSRNRGPRLTRGEAGQVGAGVTDELPTAAATWLHIDRYACRRQCFKVASGGRQRRLQLGRHGRGGHPTARLEQEQQGDEPVSTHASIFSNKVLIG